MNRRGFLAALPVAALLRPKTHWEDAWKRYIVPGHLVDPVFVITDEWLAKAKEAGYLNHEFAYTESGVEEREWTIELL